VLFLHGGFDISVHGAEISLRFGCLGGGDQAESGQAEAEQDEGEKLSKPVSVEYGKPP
jgi:hypothetical protein